MSPWPGRPPRSGQLTPPVVIGVPLAAPAGIFIQKLMSRDSGTTPPQPSPRCGEGAPKPPRKENAMRTITYYPLWIVILFWSLWSSLRTKYDPQSLFWLAERLALLELLRGHLPVPSTWYQRQVVSIVLNWIDAEIRNCNARGISSDVNLTALNG